MNNILETYLFVKKLCKEDEIFFYLVEKSMQGNKIAYEEVKEKMETIKNKKVEFQTGFWGNYEDRLFEKLLQENPLQKYGVFLKDNDIPYFMYVILKPFSVWCGDIKAYGIGGILSDPEMSSSSSKTTSYFNEFRDLFLSIIHGEEGKRIEVFFEEKSKEWEAFKKELPDLLKEAKKEVFYLKTLA